MDKNLLKQIKKILPFKKNKKFPEEKKEEIIPVKKIPQKIVEEEINPVKQPKKIRPRKKSKPKTNKNNIPLLKKNEDFTKTFKKNKPLEKIPKKILNISETKKKFQKNKNGIKIINDYSDIYEHFLNEKTSEISKTKTFYAKESSLLREKKEALKPKPVHLAKRLKRYPKPELTLDLHGFTSIQARLKIENFILSAFEKGYFTLRIITGKGIHSQAGAVLPDITEDVVKSLVTQKKVLSYSWENKKKSKSGSIIVYLNRFN
ncbi:MAG: hypothetical protein CSA18_02665 [Deltaproteobacteria bacterium]|nr:MAG: hypothetical protein CSB21_00805 [Deltaproteobacteria bacterium]PIE75026.1 MAG: hypothetical protein CSA18_02665 [Deltaproteobacteria bacterium]